MMVHRTSLAWYERVRWEYTVKCENRGFYRIGPARLKSGDLFGFFGSEKELAVNDYLLVYPRIVPLPEMGMPAARPLGETRGGIAIFQDESRAVGASGVRGGGSAEDSGLEGDGADAAATGSDV